MFLYCFQCNVARIVKFWAYLTDECKNPLDSCPLGGNTLMMQAGGGVGGGDWDEGLATFGKGDSRDFITGRKPPTTPLKHVIKGFHAMVDRVLS